MMFEQTIIDIQGRVANRNPSLAAGDNGVEPQIAILQDIGNGHFWGNDAVPTLRPTNEHEARVGPRGRRGASHPWSNLRANASRTLPLSPHRRASSSRQATKYSRNCL